MSDDLKRFKKEAAGARALNFLQTVAVNLDNPTLTDSAFRDFMRKSMEGMDEVEYTKPEPTRFPESKW